MPPLSRGPYRGSLRDIINSIDPSEPRHENSSTQHQPRVRGVPASAFIDLVDNAENQAHLPLADRGRRVTTSRRSAPFQSRERHRAGEQAAAPSISRDNARERRTFESFRFSEEGELSDDSRRYLETVDPQGSALDRELLDAIATEQRDLRHLSQRHRRIAQLRSVERRLDERIEEVNERREETNQRIWNIEHEDSVFDDSDSEPSDSEISDATRPGSNMPPRSRASGERRADEALQGSDADVEDATAAGPSRPARASRTIVHRQKDRTPNAESPPSRPVFRRPPDIIDLDKEEEEKGKDPVAEQLEEALQKQREEQVKSQAAAEESQGKKLSQQTCVICMDNFTNMAATKCGHLFCHECLISALKSSEERKFTDTGLRSKSSPCPICRKPLDRTKKMDIMLLNIRKVGKKRAET